MKRFISMLLVMCLFSMVVLPAHASGDVDAPIAVSVTTVDELKAAIEAADDGDTILVVPGIVLEDVSISSDKGITIARDTSKEDYSFHPIFMMRSNSAIEGLAFSDDTWAAGTVVVSGTNVQICNCTFEGNDTDFTFTNECVFVRRNSLAHIEACEFSNSNGHALRIEFNAEVTADGCTFLDNTRGSLENGGNATLTNCSVACGEPIENLGTLSLNDCVLEDNSSEGAEGLDISCGDRAELTITHSRINDRAYFDMETGEMLALPFHNAGIIMIHSELDETPNTPPDGDGDDNSDPITPPEGSESGDGSYTPPSVDNEDIPEPPAQIEQPEQPVRKPFACNGITLDTSRSVTLLGYGDGSKHENEPLTRAQFATIIYRLIDDDSIVALQEWETVHYVDVADSAWYAPYVQAISKAGIVCGVGGGRFDPNAPLTWAQLITVLTRFVEPKECDLHYVRFPDWSRNAMETAVSYGWLADKPNFNGNTIVTRGDAALYINYVLGLSQQTVESGSLALNHEDAISLN